MPPRIILTLLGLPVLTGLADYLPAAGLLLFSEGGLLLLAFFFCPLVGAAVGGRRRRSGDGGGGGDGEEGGAGGGGGGRGRLLPLVDSSSSASRATGEASYYKLSHLFRIDTWLALLTLHLLWPALACFVLMHYLHFAHMHCLYK